MTDEELQLSIPDQLAIGRQSKPTQLLGADD
jgi:hypothetical protein